MSDLPVVPVVIDADELEALRLHAGRYLWLRNNAVRIRGSEVWYAGDALDIRVDVGLEHDVQMAKPINEPRMLPRKSRRPKRLT